MNRLSLSVGLFFQRYTTHRIITQKQIACFSLISNTNNLNKLLYFKVF